MLYLHTGAEPVDFNALRSLPVPEPTATHVPIAHYRIVEMLRHSLTFYGHEITEEHFGVTNDGQRFFGILALKSAYGDYTDVCGLRNSHDKSFPVGVSYGAQCFVCDNLSFSGDHVIKRKHTAKALRDIHALLAELVEPLATMREQQQRKLLSYKAATVSDMLADHAIMRMYKEDVINVQRIPEVLQQWNNPVHDWGDKTAWRLFNAATFALQGRVVENPRATTQLHQIIDGICETVH